MLSDRNSCSTWESAVIHKLETREVPSQAPSMAKLSAFGAPNMASKPTQKSQPLQPAEQSCVHMAENQSAGPQLGAPYTRASGVIHPQSVNTLLSLICPKAHAPDHRAEKDAHCVLAGHGHKLQNSMATANMPSAHSTAHQNEEPALENAELGAPQMKGPDGPEAPAPSFQKRGLHKWRRTLTQSSSDEEVYLDLPGSPNFCPGTWAQIVCP